MGGGGGNAPWCPPPPPRPPADEDRRSRSHPRRWERATAWRRRNRRRGRRGAERHGTPRRHRYRRPDLDRRPLPRGRCLGGGRAGVQYLPVQAFFGGDRGSAIANTVLTGSGAVAGRVGASGPTAGGATSQARPAIWGHDGGGVDGHDPSDKRAGESMPERSFVIPPPPHRPTPAGACAPLASEAATAPTTGWGHPARAVGNGLARAPIVWTHSPPTAPGGHRASRAQHRMRYTATARPPPRLLQHSARRRRIKVERWSS